MSIEEVDASRRHAERIGNIIGWIQSIEFLLRWWLAHHGGHEIILPQHVGQVMAKTPLTDYRSLRQLITGYNSQLLAAEADYEISYEIVEIRDGLAHGRVLALEGEEHMTIYRFSEPSAGSVTATTMKALTPERLEADMDLLRVQFDRLNKCGIARGYFH